MSLTSDVQDTFDKILTDHTELTVTVVINGTTGTGLRATERQATNFTDRGEEGQITAEVRVSGATFTTKPDRGATILVDGKEAVVDDASGSGILWVIQYHEVRKITE